MSVDKSANFACLICISRSDHSADRIEIRRIFVKISCKCESPVRCHSPHNESRYRLHVDTMWKWGLSVRYMIKLVYSNVVAEHVQPFNEFCDEMSLYVPLDCGLIVCHSEFCVIKVNRSAHSIFLYKHTMCCLSLMNITIK